MTEIPLSSRLQVESRDFHLCVRCSHKGADWHHRRSRSVVDRHQHCPCNGVLLCRTCHAWAHTHPEEARAEGLIVSRHCEAPTMVPVLIDGWWWVIFCDGNATHVQSQRVVLDEGTPMVIEH